LKYYQGGEMKYKLISIASIAVLLFMVLGNSIGCTTPATYNLTITSTAGGDVTTPVEGMYTYAANATVNLTATPDSGYRFVNWTTTAGTFGSDTAATTTFTMPAQDATVTAHFALGVFIDDVPDVNQPPTKTLATTASTSNYCAPMAVVNIVYYWDDVMEHHNALNLTQNVTTNFAPETLAEYIGYFMDTNDQGSPDRPPGAHMGTRDTDIAPGTTEFILWDTLTPPPTPPPFLPPAGKAGYAWTVTPDIPPGAVGFNFYKDEIDAGRPAVVCFSYWNPVAPHVAVVDPETGETIDVYAWGDPISHAQENDPENPDEEWYSGIGHAVTGVGYILNWNPGSGLPQGNYVIVHDNWATTPKNVAVLWANWNSSHKVDPGS
jgi:hypothetical protein